DAFNKSWYLYKLPDSAGGKWFLGPVWDYDIAYGNNNYNDFYCATSTRLKDAQPYIDVVLADPVIRDDITCRWRELRKSGGPLDVVLIEKRLDQFAAHIAVAKGRDAKKWGNVGRYVWPNNFVGATWQDEVRFLKFWIRRRLAWGDAHPPGTC